MRFFLDLAQIAVAVALLASATLGDPGSDLSFALVLTTCALLILRHLPLRRKTYDFD